MAAAGVPPCLCMSCRTCAMDAEQLAGAALATKVNQAQDTSAHTGSAINPRLHAAHVAAMRECNLGGARIDVVVDCAHNKSVPGGDAVVVCSRALLQDRSQRTNHQHTYRPWQVHSGREGRWLACQRSSDREGSQECTDVQTSWNCWGDVQHLPGRGCSLLWPT